MSGASIPDLVELLNTLPASLNVFYPLIKRDLPGCSALVFSESLYEAMFSHIKPWHSFVISIWPSRTGAAGVKFVVSNSSLPSPPSELTVVLEDEDKKACCRTSLYIERASPQSVHWTFPRQSSSMVFVHQLIFLKMISQLRLILSSSPFVSLKKRPSPTTTAVRYYVLAVRQQWLSGNIGHYVSLQCPALRAWVGHLVLQQHSYERHAPTS